MFVPQSPGVVRYIIFVGAVVLFCFQIANVSPTESPGGIVSKQASHSSQGNTDEKASSRQNLTVRFFSSFRFRKEHVARDI